MSERTPDIISKINNIINETDTVDLGYRISATHPIR